MVREDELQDKWAALMESTATEDSCLPSFGQTLSQLTVEEVRYLDRLWKVVLKPTDYVSVHRFGRESLSYSNLMQVFNPHINAGLNPAEWKIFKERFSDEQKANYERHGHAVLVIEDLIRLGIIGKDEVTEHPPYEYSFSEYGVSFMRAVTVKEDSFDE
jgi:hypothetical protein